MAAENGRCHHLPDGSLRLKRIRPDGPDGGGNRVSSGVYFYRLKTEEREAVRKMVLLK